MDIFEPVLFLAEHLIPIATIGLCLIPFFSKRNRLRALFLIPAIISSAVGGIVAGSHFGVDFGGPKQYDLARPSLRNALERYISSGDGNLTSILEDGQFQPSFGTTEISYILKDLITQTILHTDTHNNENIDEGYNRGEDWFRFTLGKSMVYTSAIFENGDETLEKAQKYKLDYVAKAIDLQPGDRVLDVGCGWGKLVKYFSEEYGADVTGITLSEDQLDFARAWTQNNSRAHFYIQDGMKIRERPGLVPPGGFDKITCLEMAEHVGIRRYQTFLRSLRESLKDGGTLYFQVAGLRRWWEYEDLVWGLFMGENIFPGADASCPLGWVTTQLERAGFEVQRVHNLGTHYSRTINFWSEEWQSGRAHLEERYGAANWRRWEVFLKWSVRIARRGSSTVFMITATKAGDEKARWEAQKRLI